MWNLYSKLHPLNAEKKWKVGGGKSVVHVRYFLALVCKIWRKELILKGFKGASWACKGFKAKRLSIWALLMQNLKKFVEKYGNLGKNIWVNKVIFFNWSDICISYVNYSIFFN